MVKNNKTIMTLGEKLKSARKSAGLTQEQLAEKLLVSRQAITKWEADKGMPDIENLKQLSKLLNTSIDYLLDSGENLDLSVMREEINLDGYIYTRKLFKGRWSEKAGKKDMVVAEKYPNAKIHGLLAKQILTKAEKIMDNAIGFLTDAPFGIPEVLNSIKNTDKEFNTLSRLMAFMSLTSSPDSSMLDGSRSTPSSWCRMLLETSTGLSSMMSCMIVESVSGKSSGQL